MSRPTISVHAAIGPGEPPNVFRLDESLLDGTDVLAGAEIVGQGQWVELGDRCESVSTRRGRQRLLEQYQAGTCGVRFDNTDGELDPARADATVELVFDSNGEIVTDVNGDPVTATASTGLGYEIRPMRAIRVVATHNGDEYPMFYGYTDQWQVNASYPEGGMVSTTATDAFKIFNRIDPLEQSAVGAGDDTGERIGRILDLAEWPSTMRDLDAGNYTHQATTLAQPIATQIRLAADSERGDLYVDARGFVTFRRAMSRYLDFRSTDVQWTIGDGAGEHNPADFTTSNDDSLVRNDVNVARTGGSMQTRRSADGEIPYLRASYVRTDLTLADDLQVADHADRVLRLFSEQRPRVDTVTFEPDGVDDPDLWLMILDARFGDRVTVNLRHPYTGVLWEGDYFIEGIDHDVPVLGAGQWRTTFSLADASQFPTNPFILDSSLLDSTDALV